jgi:ribosomal protein S27E
MSLRRIEKVSDVVELISERALTLTLAGTLSLVLSALAFAYRGQGQTGTPAGWVLLIIGEGLLAYAVFQALRIRDITRVDVKCPYCNETNQVLTAPEDDFTCSFCHRLIPIQEKQVLPVSQVRCGYCNALNFYSEKTDILLCEECNREIPIATEDDGRPKKQLAAAYVMVTDDEAMYELVLTGKGHKQEELIAALQHMLALNRNQVKQILEELPSTLLTGINRRKAEMLSAQLALHDADCELRRIE